MGHLLLNLCIIGWAIALLALALLWESRKDAIYHRTRAQRYFQEWVRLLNQQRYNEVHNRLRERFTRPIEDEE